MLKILLIIIASFGSINFVMAEHVKAEEFRFISKGAIFRHDANRNPIKTNEQKRIDAIIEAFDTQNKYQQELEYRQEKELRRIIDHKFDFGRVLTLD